MKFPNWGFQYKATMLILLYLAIINCHVGKLPLLRLPLENNSCINICIVFFTSTEPKILFLLHWENKTKKAKELDFPQRSKAMEFPSSPTLYSLLLILLVSLLLHKPIFALKKVRHCNLQFAILESLIKLGNTLISNPSSK